MSPDERRMLGNYRGRRLIACRAAEALREVIEALGRENDPKELPIPDHVMPPPPDEATRRELTNLVTSVLRLILVHNDGQMSNQRLRGF